MEHSIILLCESNQFCERMVIDLHMLILPFSKMVHCTYPLVAQWIEQSRPKGEMWVRFLSRGLDHKKLPQSSFVEADNKLFVESNHRYAHLTAFFDHLLASREIARDVVLGEGNLVLGKKFLCHVTEVACRRRINCYVLFCCHSLK